METPAVITTIPLRRESDSSETVGVLRLLWDKCILLAVVVYREYSIKRSLGDLFVEFYLVNH